MRPGCLPGARDATRTGACRAGRRRRPSSFHLLRCVASTPAPFVTALALAVPDPAQVPRSRALAPPVVALHVQSTPTVAPGPLLLQGPSPAPAHLVGQDLLSMVPKPMA